MNGGKDEAGSPQPQRGTSSQKRAVSREMPFSEQVLESLPVGLMTVDSDFRITGYNAWAEELTGYPRDEVLGRPCSEVLGGAGCVETCPLGCAVREGGPCLNVETTVRTRDGRDMPVRLSSAALYDEEGNRTGGLEVLEDISGWKARKEERDQLISMFAHDMKAPVIGIRGFARRLLGREDLDAKMRRHLEAINREARNLEALVADFLELSRWQTGRLELDLRPVSLEPEVRRIVERYREPARKKGLRLEYEPQEGLPEVDADADRLGRALTNLADNAVKYTDRGGRVLVEIGETGPEIFVRVSDDGRGIDPGDLPHLFEPFRRGAESGSKKGSGLGLAAVKTVLEGHGGRVEVQSEPGQGSVFTAYLPRRRGGGDREDRRDQERGGGAP